MEANVKAAEEKTAKKRAKRLKKKQKAKQQKKSGAAKPQSSSGRFEVSIIQVPLSQFSVSNS